MELELVSVIIPVYNAEKYIKKCIDSVRNQSHTEIEVLLVDDGSKDESGAICDFYAKEDERIHVFHKKNGGPSAARNFGLQQATGRYIAFIDSDDYVEDFYLSELLSARKKITFQDDALVCSAYIDVSDYGRVICNDFKQDSQNLIQSVITGTGGVVWGKLFDRKIIQEHGICFNEDLYISEDMIFVLQYVKYVKEYTVVDKPGYIYNRLNAESIMKSINANDLYAYDCFFKKLAEVLQDLGCMEQFVHCDIMNRKATLVQRLIYSCRSKKELTKVLGNEKILDYLRLISKKTFEMKLGQQQCFGFLWFWMIVHLNYSRIRYCLSVLKRRLVDGRSIC